MNQKMSWGMFFIVVGAFYLLDRMFPNLFFQMRTYVQGAIRYDIILLVLGLFLMLKNNFTTGVLCFGFGLRLLLRGVEHSFSLFMLALGATIFVVGLLEKRNGGNHG